jgi:hypothetical protein
MALTSVEPKGFRSNEAKRIEMIVYGASGRGKVDTRADAAKSQIPICRSL